MGYDDIKISKGHTLPYLTPAQYNCYSETGETNSERGITTILATMSGTDIEILLAIQDTNKMIFPGDKTALRKVVLQDAKISGDT